MEFHMGAIGEAANAFMQVMFTHQEQAYNYTSSLYDLIFNYSTYTGSPITSLGYDSYDWNDNVWGFGLYMIDQIN